MYKKPPLKYLLLLFGIIFLIQNGMVQAQQLNLREYNRKNEFMSQQRAMIIPDKTYLVRPGFKHTGVVVKIPDTASFQDAYIVYKKDTFFLSRDEHTEPREGFISSNLIVFNELIAGFEFHSGNIKGPVKFSFLNASGQREKAYRKSKEKAFNEDSLSAPCEPPSMIDQSEWRSGLPPPNYNRIFHEVDHVIIHHSATSNSLKDYRNVVRNIYLYHTQDRGWSDIGYNYLVAPDGKIFRGRDSGNRGTEDNVKGAHFCGLNSGTMGICLIGNYVNTQPSDTSMESLKALTAWKMGKTGLDPMAFNSHPANNRLGVIAGHRDGCATACPGDKVYAQLESFRKGTLAYMNSCGERNSEPIALKVYPSPLQNRQELNLELEGGKKEVKSVTLMDMNGVALKKFTVNENTDLIKFRPQPLSAGVYIVGIHGINFRERKKLLVY